MRRIKTMLDTVYVTREAQRLHDAFQDKLANVVVDPTTCDPKSDGYTFHYKPPDSTKYYDSLRRAKKP